MQNNQADSIKIAKMMMERHGLRAGAIAQERANEAQLASDPEGLDRWRSVQGAIVELRSTSYAATRKAPTPIR
jgi:hypothetical protein